MADGPLVGFRVLDLTAVISGPFCTQLLGDLGADVIKIEPPEGDSMRRNVGPQRGGLTAAFLNFNRNKRSIVIDIKKEHGRDLVRRLAVKADALVENNRPGVADRLGIGYADIRRANPKIVYCSICGFPPKGRLANFPAYDPVIQGYSGMANVQGLKARTADCGEDGAGGQSQRDDRGACRRQRIACRARSRRRPVHQGPDARGDDGVHCQRFRFTAIRCCPRTNSSTRAQEHDARSVQNERRMAHDRAVHRRAVKAAGRGGRASGMVARERGRIAPSADAISCAGCAKLFPEKNTRRMARRCSRPPTCRAARSTTTKLC